MSESRRLIKQIGRQIDARVDTPLPFNFAPNSVKVQTFGSANKIVDSLVPVANTPWFHRQIAYSGPTYVDLFPQLFTNFSSTTQVSMFDSQNGRLIIDPVAQNYLHSYAANIYKADPTSSQVNIKWTESLAIYMNGSKVVSSQISTNSFSIVYLPFITGWNKLDIMIFSSSAGKRFDLGVSLGSIAEGWVTPQSDDVSAPTGVTLKIDDQALSERNENTNILEWNQNTESNIGGYRVYRRGPYDPGT